MGLDDVIDRLFDEIAPLTALSGYALTRARDDVRRILEAIDVVADNDLDWLGEEP